MHRMVVVVLLAISSAGNNYRTCEFEKWQMIQSQCQYKDPKAFKRQDIQSWRNAADPFESVYKKRLTLQLLEKNPSKYVRFTTGFPAPEELFSVAAEALLGAGLATRNVLDHLGTVIHAKNLPQWSPSQPVLLGFELRMGSHTNQLDFSMLLRKKQFGTALQSLRNSTLTERSMAWIEVLNYLEKYTTSLKNTVIHHKTGREVSTNKPLVEFLSLAAQSIWLEFDVPPERSVVPDPSVHLILDDKVAATFKENTDVFSLAKLIEEDGIPFYGSVTKKHAYWLAQAIGDTKGGTIYCLGIWLGRKTSKIRVHLTLGGVENDGLADCEGFSKYLSNLQCPSLQDIQVMELCKKMRQACDSIVAAVDIGKNGVGSKVGLECHRDHHRTSSFDSILNLVEKLKLSAINKKSLKKWVEASGNTLSNGATLVTAINHIKIVLDSNPNGGTKSEAKVYLAAWT
eukprot:m.277521 g.277521  ORF g.277521 m.277521 type:complete len:456 (-) comp16307_c0_seq15:2092-3459(-)